MELMYELLKMVAAFDVWSGLKAGDCNNSQFHGWLYALVAEGTVKENTPFEYIWITIINIFKCMFTQQYSVWPISNSILAFADLL